jgi:lambda family phage portal protein
MMQRLRRAWQAFRGYDAAKDWRSNHGWRPSGGSANSDVGGAAASVARRARDAVRNDPYAARIVDLWASNAVGAGITTRWPDTAHADAWRRWAESTACDAEGMLDFAGIQALVMRAVVESGEVFVRYYVSRPTPQNPIGLQLQVLESDFLDTSRASFILEQPIVQGIALTDRGQPRGYWLYRQHPGQTWWMPNVPRESEFVSASDCLHIYRKRRPGQLRDVSWLAPVLIRLRDLSDYEQALLVKAKVEACLALVSSGNGEDALTGASSSLLKDAEGRAVEALEPGMILHRDAAGSIEVVNPSGGGSHTAFARRALEAAAVGTGLTYDQVSGDLTQANYSSLRAGKIEFRRLCEQIQYGMLIPMLVRPVAERFHWQGALAGLWQADMPADVGFVPPAHEMIDPLKDTTALVAQVRAGFVPQAEAVGAFGYDFRSTIEAIRQSNEMLDDAGLALDTDPRRVAKSGVVQDAGQMAAIEIAATGAAMPLRPDEPARQPQE